jgi:hypothetical protein
LMLSGWTCNRHSLRGNSRNFLCRRFEERPWNTKLSNLKSFRRQIHVAGNGSSFSMQPTRGLASHLHVPTPCWMPNSPSRRRWRTDHAASSNSGFSAARADIEAGAAKQDRARVVTVWGAISDLDAYRRLPLYPNKQTSLPCVGMSQMPEGDIRHRHRDWRFVGIDVGDDRLEVSGAKCSRKLGTRP